MHRLAVISKARSTKLSNTATWLPGEKCINALEASYSCRERWSLRDRGPTMYSLCIFLLTLLATRSARCYLILCQWNVVETQGQQHRNRNKKRNQTTFEPSQSDPMLEWQNYMYKYSFPRFAGFSYSGCGSAGFSCSCHMGVVLYGCCVDITVCCLYFTTVIISMTYL